MKDNNNKNNLAVVFNKRGWCNFNAFKLYVVNLSIYMNSFQLKLRIDEQLYPVMKAKMDDKLDTMTRDKLLLMPNRRYIPTNEIVNHPPQSRDRVLARTQSVNNRDNTDRSVFTAL